MTERRNSFSTNSSMTIITGGRRHTCIYTSGFLGNSACSVFVSTRLATTLSINNLNSSKSNLTISCSSRITSTERSRIRVYCYYRVCFYASTFVEQVPCICHGIGKLSRNNSITFSGAYSNSSVFTLIDSPVCTGCIVFTGITSATNSNGNITVHSKRRVLSGIGPIVRPSIISN